MPWRDRAVRSDAATILALGDRLDVVFAYDTDLMAALVAEAYEVAAPGLP